MRRLLSIAVLLALGAAMAASNLEVARQALSDGVWDVALSAADIAATNAATRTPARLMSLEALAHLGRDEDIRHRLSAWTEETDEHFRYWRARSQVRVGDFQQAEVTLERPFTDPALALPVKCLKASMRLAMGDKKGALDIVGSEKLDDKAGAAVDDARLIIGEILFADGKIDEARTVLRPLVERGGYNEVWLRASYLLGFAEMASESTCTAGVARVQKLLRAHPGGRISVPAAKVFAEKLLALGYFAVAEDEYRRYFEINPAAVTEPDALNGRGLTLFRLGRYSEAAGAFARAEQASTNGAMKAAAAFRQADAFAADRRYIEAAGSYKRSAELDGNNVSKAHFFEADARERAGEKTAAAEIYVGIAKEDGEWGEKAKLRLAAMTARDGKLGEAINEYGELIASNRLSAADMMAAHLGRGRACYREYRFKEAASDFREVAKMDPSLSDGMRFLEALCLYGEGKDIDAKAVAASLMGTTKNDDLRADLRLWCAKYEYNHGKYEDARANFEAFATMRAGTEHAAEALLWAARCAAAATDYSKAVELATQAANAAVSNRTFFAETLLVQGEAVMELGRYAEALQLFDRAATQAGDSADAVRAMVLKADALYAMGAGDTNRYAEAVAAYMALPEGSALTPDRRIEVAFKIGRALEKQRRAREAMDQYYRGVVLAYSEGSANGVLFGAASRIFFARAAFSLADYYETAGNFRAAKEILDKVVSVGVPASEEAKRRIDALKKKGGIR